MRIVIIAAAAALLLSGCASVQESASSKSAFETKLLDGRVVQCVQVTSHDGSVAVSCDFDNAR